ncbi:MAG: hypothetical protein WB773_18810 [Isosphaeraceae bacterium]
MTFSLSAMRCHHGSVCVSGGHGGWHRQACYSSCYSGGCYGGSYVGRYMGGYSQGWPSPAYAPVTYSGAGYSAASGQMASYAPMSAGYAMPVASYHLYTAATPMTYGTPGTMTYGTPGTSTYSSAYGRPASGIYPNAAPGQMAPGGNFQGPASTYQPGSINQGMNNMPNGVARMSSPNPPISAPAPATVPASAVPRPNP